MDDSPGHFANAHAVSNVEVPCVVRGKVVRCCELGAFSGPSLSQKPLLAGKTSQAAWRSKPSFYAVSTEDRTINPDLQRFMARRMEAKTLEVKASHVSLISQPDRIAAMILEAAAQRA